MNLKRNLIGSLVYHPILNKMILIEKGREEEYARLGMDVFTKPHKPKLQKNVKSTKRRHDERSSDSNGVDNDQ